MKRAKGKAATFFFDLVLLLAVSGILMMPARWAQERFYRAAYPIHYREMVEDYSAQNGLPPSLVYAVIRTESDFDPDAHSRASARGLMQITEETFRWVAFREGEEGARFTDLLDGETNIRYGTALLRLHIEEFDTARNALVAYHAGRGRLQEWLADPTLSPDGREVELIPSPVTDGYVHKVLETQRMYQRLYEMD